MTPLLGSLKEPLKSGALCDLAARLLQPAKKTHPDEWGAENRVYPLGTGLPGPRNPYLTPYMVAFERAIHSRDYRRVVAVMGAQMGKTEGMLDVIGAHFDQRPAPMLYVGPSREFLTDQFEPRLMSLIDESATLRAKMQRGKRNKKTLKWIAGNRLRLAHAGSQTALKSDPAAIALVDEYDAMVRNVQGQGDPLSLVEARGQTFTDFVAAVVSTPSRGIVGTEIDPVSGLEFWKQLDDDAVRELESPIWRLFNQGTRYHWAWPCPHCGSYFIPRFRNLKWPDRATPAQARRAAYLCCPVGGCVIEDAHKPAMNARGVFVAPGQTVDKDGVVAGDPPETNVWSMWTSGLASPFVSFGERAEKYLTAQIEGTEQTEFNASFGECFAEGGGGDVPEWQEVYARRRDYRHGDTPPGVLGIVAGVDVQKRSIIYVVRGFGARQQSWLLDHGQIYGDTDDDGGVWDDLFDLLQTTYDGLPISRAFIDSGFRPDKPEAGNEHRVYAFCRKYSMVAFATKGHDRQASWIMPRKVDITVKGQKAKTSLQLYHLDSDHFKGEVHSRIRRQDDEVGAFYLYENIDEDYCKQIVSEARVMQFGKPVWLRRSRQNHFLDCEALAAAAAFSLRLHQIRDGAKRATSQRRAVPSPAAEPIAPTPPPPAARPAPRGGGWLGGGGGGWLGGRK